MGKYKYSPDIIYMQVEKVEIIRETVKCFFVPTKSGESMIKKHSRNGKHFDTFEDAKAYLIKALNNRLASYKRNLKETREDIKKAELLKEATP